MKHVALFKRDLPLGRCNMQPPTEFEDHLGNLMDSPGGKLIAEIREHILKRIPFLAIAFFSGLIVGYPLASIGVEWLVSDANLTPTGTSIVVLSPVEFIAIKIRFAAALGVLLVATVLIGDVSFGAARSTALRARLVEADVKVPKPGLQLMMSMLAVPILAAAGLYYAYELLLPLLLEYLSKDAAAAGLETDWRLSSYIGFIINMSLASMIGFQTPLLTFLTVRSGTVDRASLAKLRRHIWFASCVFGALLSPPDPLSLFLVALPVILLFEVALILDRIVPSRI